MIERKKIFSKEAPKAIGPYSQAVASGGFLFCSGQIGLDPITNTLIPGGVAEQTKQVLRNLEVVLKEVGVLFDDVVKAEIYLVNMDDFGKVNEIYATMFNKEPFPARVTVGVSSLPKGALVEIACIAKA
jgi:2-iminobutanoate/2-iminopropanoate deaminase